MASRLKDLVYTSEGTKLRNGYRDNYLLVVRQVAVFPYIGVACGRAALGNILYHEFSDVNA